MGWLRASIPLAASLAIAACAAAPTQPCREGQQWAVTDSLYFGTATPNGAITPEQWSEFVSGVITPRFPRGLTSWEARGQWQGAAGVIEREASYVVQLIHPDTEDAERAVREVTQTYKAQFQQEAVLRVRSHACVSL